MFFSEVIGQENIKQRLIRSVQEDRVSHAQLFLGHEGTGALGLALAYAQYISCGNRGENDSCGTCPSCRKYKKLIHPDLHFVFPVFNSPKYKNPISDSFIKEWREMVLKSHYFSLSQWLNYIDAGNAQVMIYERESDSIYRKLSLKSFESDFKVMIIWQPEKMNISCSNKLLKLIEEPPNKTLFLFVAENEEEIIPTIRSRVQLNKIPFIEKEPLKKALLDLGAEHDIIIDAIHLSNGNYLKAISFLTPDENEQFYFSKFQEMMRMAYSRHIPSLINWAEEMAKIGRDKQKLYFHAALRLVREYFIFNMKKMQMVYLNHDEIEWGKRFAPFINERNIIPMSEEFELAIKNISMNGNPRIIFLNTALRIVKLIKR
ncbi:MAG: DNA polymerase III subunit delta [Bacteroidales bacterium]|jgi:DNA polymerase-3 subunit delta'|nr:DNA polymerase III subunit delta [Bacteroidales bacterium]